MHKILTDTCISQILESEIKMRKDYWYDGEHLQKETWMSKKNIRNNQWKHVNWHMEFLNSEIIINKFIRSVFNLFLFNFVLLLVVFVLFADCFFHITVVNLKKYYPACYS